MTNRYFIRAADVPNYHPANHSGTVNKRLSDAMQGSRHILAALPRRPAAREPMTRRENIQNKSG